VPGEAQSLELRTDAFYSDRPVRLDFPPGWTLTVHWPRTPAPCSDEAIREALEHPAGQAPIRELARGKRRPLIIVDDLTRPTPVHRVMPFVLAQLREAGIAADDVRILMSTGTHGAPTRPDGMARKVGTEAAAVCRLLVHDHLRNVVRVGTTSFGTPVLVDREVAASDLVIGIGGVYPHNMSSFGGGTKLALGVLHERSIYNLHYRHTNTGSTGALENSFRRDLNEVAALIGMRTVVSLHVDADRQAVRIVSGDPAVHYRDSATFSREAFQAPAPREADVVIANAYPIDVNLTLAVFKGGTPFRYAPPQATRVIIATCGDGVGQHGLFPFINIPPFHRQRQLLRRALVMKRSEVAGRVARKIVSSVRRRSPAPDRAQPSTPAAPAPASTILFRPVTDGIALPSLPNMAVVSEWTDVVNRIRGDHGDRTDLRVVIYPCAPLQGLDA
jgi:nickel-dependent lactate racemase